METVYVGVFEKEREGGGNPFKEISEGKVKGVYNLGEVIGLIQSVPEAVRVGSKEISLANLG